jgi:hypothetical protein
MIKITMIIVIVLANLNILLQFEGIGRSESSIYDHPFLAVCAIFDMEFFVVEPEGNAGGSMGMSKGGLPSEFQVWL